MPTEIALPSGLRGTIRELGVREENILSDPKLARNGKNLHRVLENCWEETLDPGIYKFEDDKIDPGALLQGDALVYLVNLRIATYGEEFIFDINCPACGVKIPWELNLREYLEMNIKPLPEESKSILKAGGLFEFVLPKCGRKVKFGLVTLNDELRFPQVRRQSPDRLSSILLDLSVKEIEGIEFKRAFLGSEPWSKREGVVPEYMLSSDANDLRNEMEEVNGGLITQFEVECVTHGEVSVELPFQNNFFLPKKLKR